MMCVIAALPVHWCCSDSRTQSAAATIDRDPPSSRSTRTRPSPSREHGAATTSHPSTMTQAGHHDRRRRLLGLWKTTLRRLIAGLRHTAAANDHPCQARPTVRQPAKVACLAPHRRGSGLRRSRPRVRLFQPSRTSGNTTSRHGLRRFVVFKPRPPRRTPGASTPRSMSCSIHKHFHDGRTPHRRRHQLSGTAPTARASRWRVHSPGNPRPMMLPRRATSPRSTPGCGAIHPHGGGRTAHRRDGGTTLLADHDPAKRRSAPARPPILRLAALHAANTGDL